MVSLSALGLKLHKNEVPPTKSDSTLVCEALMMELESQIKEADRLCRQIDKEMKIGRNVADYSWLVAAPSKSYEIPQMERLALEDLAFRVEAKDSNEIITQFRAFVEGIARQPKELPQIMRSLIERYLADKPVKEGDSTLNWITRSVSQLGGNLRTLKSHSSNKVYPVASTFSEGMIHDRRRVKSMSDFNEFRQLPVWSVIL